MSSLDFKRWCSDNGLKERTIETLRNNDLDSHYALKLVHADDVGTLDLINPRAEETVHAGLKLAERQRPRPKD